MYPPVTQLETRRRELEDELQSHRQRTRAERDANVTPPRVAPPRYKLALLTWAGAYALITLTLTVLGPAMATWPLALRTLVLSMTMVVSLTWIVMPRLTRLFRPWLTANG
jgi:antibiotic biosynthesis monooxygenase (ABM) superfamily enzyme